MVRCNGLSAGRLVLSEFDNDAVGRHDVCIREPRWFRLWFPKHLDSRGRQLGNRCGDVFNAQAEVGDAEVAMDPELFRRLRDG